jgi:hypothetical protein
MDARIKSWQENRLCQNPRIIIWLLNSQGFYCIKPTLNQTVKTDHSRIQIIYIELPSSIPKNRGRSFRRLSVPEWCSSCWCRTKVGLNVFKLRKGTSASYQTHASILMFSASGGGMTPQMYASVKFQRRDLLVHCFHSCYRTTAHSEKRYWYHVTKH